MKIIAFYLPQYHPTEHNNEWWGKGFTEWTNVAKAKKYFRAHYQPKIPADLGFYDLRLPEVREQQVMLAKEAGVDAFCYYHYWFGNGNRELDLPFNEVLKNKKPDFPFCVCWANHSWFQKTWDPRKPNRLLVEQTYPGEDDYKKHFETLLPAFKDPRYFRIDGKPVFVIYKPLHFKDFKRFICLWNGWAKEQSLPGIHFIAYTLDIRKEYEALKDCGVDSICSCRLDYLSMVNRNEYGFVRYLINQMWSRLWRRLLHRPKCLNYKRDFTKLIGDEEISIENVFPTLVPNWDHTPRSGDRGYLFTNSTPELFQKHCEDVFLKIASKKEENQIVFLKSWNEWGEGNYMEPDLKFGHGYINALKNALKKNS